MQLRCPCTRINMCEVLGRYWNSGLAKGREEGLAAGRQEGLAAGRQERAVETARILKNSGIDTELIAKSTGLSAEEVRKL